MIRIILKGKQIPDCSTVRKVSGSRAHKLVKSIKVFAEDASIRYQFQELKINDTVFLISETGHITAYLDSTEFAVEMDYNDAIDLIKEVRDLDYNEDK